MGRESAELGGIWVRYDLLRDTTPGNWTLEDDQSCWSWELLDEEMKRAVRLEIRAGCRDPRHTEIKRRRIVLPPHLPIYRCSNPPRPHADPASRDQVESHDTLGRRKADINARQVQKEASRLHPPHPLALPTFWPPLTPKSHRQESAKMS